MLKKIAKGRYRFVSEGLSPIYKNGVITPETKGLGPKYEKDIKIKVMPKPKVVPKKKQPKIRNIRNLA